VALDSLPVPEAASFEERAGLTSRSQKPTAPDAGVSASDDTVATKRTTHLDLRKQLLCRKVLWALGCGILADVLNVINDNMLWFAHSFFELMLKKNLV
jgi:hypothetical protein